MGRSGQGPFCSFPWCCVWGEEAIPPTTGRLGRLRLGWPPRKARPSPDVLSCLGWSPSHRPGLSPRKLPLALSSSPCPSEVPSAASCVTSALTRTLGALSGPQHKDCRLCGAQINYMAGGTQTSKHLEVSSTLTAFKASPARATSTAKLARQGGLVSKATCGAWLLGCLGAQGRPQEPRT